ncbi:hypothetical protein C6V06_30905 [Burkholderia gladioli]|nr:hypothetical protein C6V06_30905 [Burkholderia gladioli]PRH05717.1 hypothetical protein C6V08_10250 [Burkholderia gladioli]
MARDPFYLGPLTAAAAHAAMREAGVRFNDFGTSRRANRRGTPKAARGSKEWMKQGNRGVGIDGKWQDMAGWGATSRDAPARTRASPGAGRATGSPSPSPLRRR